jgi:hypothetical protein
MLFQHFGKATTIWILELTQNPKPAIFLKTTEAIRISKSIKPILNQAWWHMPVIPALRRLR